MCVPHKNIHEAKLAVMSEVPYLRKRKGKDLPYTFAGEADLLAKVQPSFVKHGIDCAPVDASLMFNGEYQTGKGHRMAHMGFVLTYEFTHAESDTKQTVKVISEAADSSDKCCGKAMTGALKYAIRQFLLIETGDDPDKVRHDRPTQDEAAQLAAGMELSKKLYEERCGWISGTSDADYLVNKLRPGVEKDQRLLDADRNDLLKKIDARAYSLRQDHSPPEPPDAEISAMARGEYMAVISEHQNRDKLVTDVRKSIDDDKRLTADDKGALVTLLVGRAKVLETATDQFDWGDWQNRQETNFKKIKTVAQRKKATEAVMAKGAPQEVSEYLLKLLGKIDDELTRSNSEEPISAA